MGAGNQHLPLRAKLCHLLTLGSVSNFIYLLYACLVLYVDFGANAEAAASIVRARNHTAAAQGLAQAGTDDYYYEPAAGDAYWPWPQQQCTSAMRSCTRWCGP